MPVNDLEGMNNVRMRDGEKICIQKHANNLFYISK